MRHRLRVIAGTAGSLFLDGPASKARPTTDRTREVLFSSVGEAVEGRPFVDLYAGSGAVGIEALSRGASRCLFVEGNGENVRVIQANLAKTKLGAQAEVWRKRVEEAAERLAGWLDGEAGVIFADPPYEDAGALKVWGKVLGVEGLPAGTIMVLESSSRTSLAMLPEPVKEKRVGETRLSYWEN